MTGLLEGRIAVVTGGGSGIGRAIALGYAREGAPVAILDCNGDAAAETVQAITGVQPSSASSPAENVRAVSAYHAAVSS
jgi:NAD(P)-dependent dehydrogenase (short-subunit alcohol dehydrogenase family)